MQRSAFPLRRSLRSLHRSFSSSENSDNILASVLFERLPVVIPKIDPAIYAFKEFQLRWKQKYRRKYTDEVLVKADDKGKGDYQIQHEPAMRITAADKKNDRKSLQRALDRRLYLLLYGTTYGAPEEKPTWHFPEKVYENEETLRLCAESALKSVIGGLHNTYFVGNAPVGHMAVGPTEDSPGIPSFKQFFFKSQLFGTTKLAIGNCKDYVWVTKDELMEYFPEKASFFDQIIIY